jgi:hypothetical protein
MIKHVLWSLYLEQELQVYIPHQCIVPIPDIPNEFAYDIRCLKFHHQQKHGINKFDLQAVSKKLKVSDIYIVAITIDEWSNHNDNDIGIRLYNKEREIHGTCFMTSCEYPNITNKNKNQIICNTHRTNAVIQSHTANKGNKPHILFSCSPILSKIKLPKELELISYENIETGIKCRTKIPNEKEDTITLLLDLDQPLKSPIAYYLNQQDIYPYEAINKNELLCKENVYNSLVKRMKEYVKDPRLFTNIKDLNLEFIGLNDENQSISFKFNIFFS